MPRFLDSSCSAVALLAASSCGLWGCGELGEPQAATPMRPALADIAYADTSAPDLAADGVDDTGSDAAPLDTTDGDVDAVSQDADAPDAPDTVDADVDADVPPPPPECDLPVPFDVDATWTARIVVATDGDDAGGDGSDMAPYASVARALQDAVPGTRIAVQAGTYDGPLGFVDTLQGTAQAPIGIVAEGGEVVLDAGGSAELVHLSEPRYVVLDGLTLRNASSNAVRMTGSRDAPVQAEHVVLRNLTVDGSGQDNHCVRVAGVDHLHVLDSALSNCNMGFAIHLVGSHDTVIAGNEIHDTPDRGIQIQGGSADILITGNRFRRVQGRAIQAGGGTLREAFDPADAPYEAARVRIVGNLFEEPGAAAGGATYSDAGCDTCVFAHNTVVDPQGWVVRILNEQGASGDAQPGRDGLFVNNLLVFDVEDLDTYSWVNVGAGTLPETFTFDHNLWFSTDSPDFAGPLFQGGVSSGPGSLIQQDPLLDATHRPQPGSPAIAAGQALPGSPLRGFDGTCFADSPTLGAFEVQ